MADYDHELKFVLLGTRGVGKSTLIQRLADDTIVDDNKAEKL